MATFSAIKALGSAIKADFTASVEAATAAIERKRAQRAVISDFKELLKEDPALVAKAFAQLSVAEAAKPARKPRAAKPAAEAPAKPARKPRAKKTAE